jgi:hypothetical protein
LEVSHLDLSATIEPETSHVRVTGDAAFRGVEGKLEFILNPSLEVLKVNALSGKKEIELDTTEVKPPTDLFAPAAKYEVALPEDLKNQEEVEISVEYEGKIYRYIYDTTRVRSSFVELAIYALWYPMVDFGDRPSFTLKLEAPEDWIWISNATLTSSKPLTWDSDGPLTDITLHGRPRSNAISPDESSLFWGEPRYLERVKPLEQKFNSLRETIVSWFGDPPSQDLRIILVPRDFGGGYARNGLIVMQDDAIEELKDNEEAMIEFWGHEYSHSWFKKTTVEDYHNWVDEACATYASLLAIESIYGKELFAERIEKYRKKIEETENLSPIKSTMRQDPNAQTIYYVYGTLILHEIREKIGREKSIEFMSRFARRCAKEEKIVTDDLTETLEQVTNEEWASFIEDRLSMTPRPLR